MPEAHALGHVQMIWESCYERADPDLGDVTDVELSAGWVGDPGDLCAALLSCGGEGPGLIEVGPDGRHFVHDFWHHAPKYVSERARKNEERMASGETISSLRAKAGAMGAAKKWQNHGKRMASEWQPDGKMPTICHEQVNGNLPTICHNLPSDSPKDGMAKIETNPDSGDVIANGWQVNGNLLPDQSSTVQYGTIPSLVRTSTCTNTTGEGGTGEGGTGGGGAGGGGDFRGKKTTKKSDNSLTEYPAEVHDVVAYAKEKWRREDPDGRKINPDWSMTRSRVSAIMQSPEVKMGLERMAEVLKKAIDIYLEKQKKAYKAPQFFFGPGTAENPTPWRPYATDAYHIIMEGLKNAKSA